MNTAKNEVAVLAQPVTAVTVTPMQMLQMAVERGADLDQMQKLMDLQERYEKNEARKAYVAAMAIFKRNPPEVLKAKHVRFQTSKGVTEYDHATLADVVAAATRALADVGISHRWSVAQAEGRITVSCILTHELGHSESVSMTALADDSGNKNSIQSIGSTTSYLQRYTLLAATGLATRDMPLDNDGRGEVETIGPGQVADLEALITEVGADRANFLRFCRVESLEEIAVERYGACVAALRSRRGK
jgi:hypothetical protein